MMVGGKVLHMANKVVKNNSLLTSGLNVLRSYISEAFSPSCFLVSGLIILRRECMRTYRGSDVVACGRLLSRTEDLSRPRLATGFRNSVKGC